jgi:type VI protein secretion system component Hcp
MEFRKENDIASGHLMQRFFTGEAAPTVTIDFIRTDQTVDVYYQITLTNAIVSAFVQDSSGDRPLEVFNLNYTKIECKTQQMSPTGAPGNPFTTGYDLSTGQSN